MCCRSAHYSPGPERLECVSPRQGGGKPRLMIRSPARRTGGPESETVSNPSFTLFLYQNRGLNDRGQLEKGRHSTGS